MNKNPIIQNKQVIKYINKGLESAHYIYTDEMTNFEFKKISKYSKSKELYDKVVHDFKKVNELIDEKDYFNAATILRTLYENILYIIVSSYQESIIITVKMGPQRIRNILKENCKEWVDDCFEGEDFDELYERLSKIIHPCSMKELISHLVNKSIYKDHMLMNLKFIMIVIEYIYICYLNKKIGKDGSFDSDLFNFSTYVNWAAGMSYSYITKKEDEIIKKYMMNEADIEYIEKKKQQSNEITKAIEENAPVIEQSMNEITARLTKIVTNSKYKEPILKILK